MKIKNTTVMVGGIEAPVIIRYNHDPAQNDGRYSCEADAENVYHEAVLGSGYGETESSAIRDYCRDAARRLSR